jgi:5-methylcytosine-specific restriction endonuclease McrA
MPIDYTLPKTDPEHFQLDHIKSRKRFPRLEFDPNNWAPAHASCNKHKSDNDAGADGIGQTSEQW